MEEPAGVEPTPQLDDLFVLGAEHRELSHRERELEAARRQAQQRSERYRAELDRGIEEARRSRRRLGRRPRRPSAEWSGRSVPRASRRRKAIGAVIAVAVIGTAVYINGYPHPSATGLPAVPSRQGPCPASLYPAGSEYRFERCAAGQPLGWGRCRVLTVSTDSAKAPLGWRADVEDALDQLAAATGLHFKSSSRKADIAISWAAEKDLPGDAGADKAGVTQVQSLSTASASRLVNAHVQIATELAAGRGRNGEVPVLLHELGHAVGMGHYVGEVVMNPVDQGYPVYQSGDLAGLAFLYRPGSCG